MTVTTLRVVRVLALTVVFALALSVTGCKKKKPKLPPPQTTPPAITVPESQPPAETIPKIEPEHPAPTTTNPPASTTTPAPKPKRSTRPKTSTKKPATTTPKQTPPPTPPAATAPKTAPENSDSVSISSATPDGSAQKKSATEHLLQDTEGNLRKINRQLNEGEEAIVRQVRNYITQSRLATQDGDFERANNLALKANLLSQEIAK